MQFLTVLGRKLHMMLPKLLWTSVKREHTHNIFVCHTNRRWLLVRWWIQGYQWWQSVWTYFYKEKQIACILILQIPNRKSGNGFSFLDFFLPPKNLLLTLFCFESAYYLTNILRNCGSLRRTTTTKRWIRSEHHQQEIALKDAGKKKGGVDARQPSCEEVERIKNRKMRADMLHTSINTALW